MDLFKTCDSEDIRNPLSEEDFEYLPCQNKFGLCPEDEISLDSIFSAVLSVVVEPSEKQFECNWGINTKDLLNGKQPILFEEHLCISKLRDTNCKLCEESKSFLERELEQIGSFCLKVVESYDDYVVLSSSKMRKGNGNTTCGHSLRGKYDDKFVLISEKRTEYEYVDNVLIENHLESRRKLNTLSVFRETKINKKSQKFKTAINMKGQEEVFVLNGGYMLLMRYLIINNFRGDFKYYSINLFGKIIHCTLTVHSERKKLQIFNKTTDNAISVVNIQYFNDVAQDGSETYFTGDGKMVLHFWHGFNYLLHAACEHVKPPERILPKLQLIWKADNLLFKKWQLKKKLNYENAITYLMNKPEVADVLYDYIICLLAYKPANILEFTVKFFQNMKNTL